MEIFEEFKQICFLNPIPRSKYSHCTIKCGGIYCRDFRHNTKLEDLTYASNL